MYRAIATVYMVCLKEKAFWLGKYFYIELWRIDFKHLSFINTKTKLITPVAGIVGCHSTIP